MTIIVKIKQGGKHTFWNVTEVILKQDQCYLRITDRPDAIVQGFIEKIERKD
jgi:hypothetical protein